MISLQRSQQSKDKELIRKKADAVVDLMKMVTAVRSAYVTALPGQELIYLAKEAEAKQYLESAVEPADLSEFPLLAAEVGFTATTPYELAQIWINMAVLWRQVAATTEQARLKGVKKLTDALDEAEVLLELENAKADLVF